MVQQRVTAISRADESICSREYSRRIEAGGVSEGAAATGRAYSGHGGNDPQLRKECADRLQEIGFDCIRPAGAYYIMADITPFGYDDDVAFAKYLAEKIGVAVVPGSSFYRPESIDGKKLIRFCFCKELSTLEAAVERLQKLRS